MHQNHPAPIQPCTNAEMTTCSVPAAPATTAYMRACGRVGTHLAGYPPRKCMTLNFLAGRLSLPYHTIRTKFWKTATRPTRCALRTCPRMGRLVCPAQVTKRGCRPLIWVATRAADRRSAGMSCQTPSGQFVLHDLTGDGALAGRCNCDEAPAHTAAVSSIARCALIKLRTRAELSSASPAGAARMRESAGPPGTWPQFGGRCRCHRA